MEVLKKLVSKLNPKGVIPISFRKENSPDVKLNNFGAIDAGQVLKI